MPKPHPDFEGYAVRTTKKTGICQINATTKTISNDRFGIEARSLFNKIKDQLSSIYGNGKLSDFHRSGGIWKGSHEWVMSIRQNERVYQQVWDAESNANLKDNIKEIIMAINAGSSDASWISLQYRFGNYDECEKEMNNQGKGSL